MKPSSIMSSFSSITGTSPSSPRIEGPSINISGGTSGNNTSVSNPLIRRAMQEMELNQFLYGTPYSESMLKGRQVAASLKQQEEEAQRFLKFARGRGDLSDPVSAANVRGMWEREKSKQDQQARGARIAGEYGYGSKQYGDFLAGQRATYDPRRD